MKYLAIQKLASNQSRLAHILQSICIVLHSETLWLWGIVQFYPKLNHKPERLRVHLQNQKIMLKERFMASLLLIPFSLLTACAQQESDKDQEETATAEIQSAQKTNGSVRGYIGWYCPDNLGGLPPVNVADLAAVPVVNGRMPTEEETRNGTSLMYFDPADYPTAKPVQMTLPKLARYYSENTKQNELVIIIQAVVVDEDTVVGFRYVDGGNGTSWFKEVDILSDNEVAALDPTPFVFLTSEINAPKEKIWAAIANTAYAKNLGKRFNQTEFFEKPWTPGAHVDFNYEMLGDKANGIIMTLFGNVYLQIDYENQGRQSVDKILIMDNEDGKSAKIQIVFGPYADHFGSQHKRSKKWLEEVKTVSEAE